MFVLDIHLEKIHVRVKIIFFLFFFLIKNSFVLKAMQIQVGFLIFFSKILLVLAYYSDYFVKSGDYLENFVK